MTRVSDELGRWGEEVAAAHLRDRGMQVLETRWRCPGGELDLVARDGRTLVFIEVKTRSGSGFGGPLEAVGGAKQRRIRRLATAWLGEHSEHADEIRFDVVGILRGPSGVVVTHLQAAF